MLNIFVSSTYDDLKYFRDQICRLIRTLGLNDIAMEKWPPASNPPIDEIKSAMANSDVYVGILAWKYGSRINDDFSYTEYEYQLANEKKLPRIMFLTDPEKPWAVNLVDIGIDGDAIRRFRGIVKNDNTILWKYFQEEMDLIQNLSGALFKEVIKSNKYKQIKEIDKAILRIRQQINEDFLARRNEIEYEGDEANREWFITEISRCNIGSKYIERIRIRKDIADWLFRNKCPFLFIIGPAGIGKTNFLIMEIINYLISNFSTDKFSLLATQSIIFLAAGSYNVEESLLENLDGFKFESNINDSVLKELIESGKALLIVDGLDEFVRNNGEDKVQVLLQEINSIINPNKSKIIITCRDHIFKKLDSQQYFPDRKMKEFINIPPLNTSEVIRAVEVRLGKQSAGFIAITTNQTLIKFAQTPLLLEMMCRISRESWKKLIRSQMLGVLYDLWFEEIISTSAMPEELLMDEFISETNIKVGQIAGIMLKKRSDLITETELNNHGLDIQSLKTLTRQPFGLFIKQTPIEWGFVHDSFREFSLAKTIATEFTSHKFELLAKTSSFDYVGAETFRFLNDILPKSNDFFNHIETSLELTKSDNEVWNNIVRNSFEAVGMIGDITEKKFISEAISILNEPTYSNKNKETVLPTIKTKYNLARALERMHTSSPRPYFRHILNKDWKPKPTWDSFGATAIRGFHALHPYPNPIPPMVYNAYRNDSNHYMQYEVSECLLNLIQEALKKNSVQDYNFLEINASYALIRWLHIEHIKNIKNLLVNSSITSYSKGNIFQALLRFKDASIFNNCDNIFKNMEISWLYINTDMVPANFHFKKVIFDKYEHSIFEGFAPHRFIDCTYK